MFVEPLVHFSCYGPVLPPYLSILDGLDGFSRAVLEREKDKEEDKGRE